MNAIQRLYMVRAEIKQKEKEADLLKCQIKQTMADLGDVYQEVDGYAAIIKEKERKSINAMQLEIDMGYEFVQKYHKVSKYSELTIIER